MKIIETIKIALKNIWSNKLRSALTMLGLIIGMIPAQRAKEISLVNEVFSLEDLLPKAKELASAIAKNSPQAIEKAIKAVNLSDTDKGFETEIKFFGELFEQEDKQEGVTAFLEKRKPEFK